MEFKVVFVAKEADTVLSAGAEVVVVKLHFLGRAADFARASG
jgi:hypothetical protein